MVGSHKYIMLILALMDSLFHKQTSSYAFSYTEEYEEFCQQSCSSTGLVPTEKCNPCFCDDNCSVLRDCCPDKNITSDDDYSSSCQRVIFPELSKKTKLNSETCSSAYPGFRGCNMVEFETYENGYKLVTSCLSDFDDPETRRLCQGIDTVLPSTIRPVTDVDTGLSFRNIHCSKCNRVTSNLKMWPLWVICRNELPERLGNSLQQLHHAIKNTEGCSIRFAAEGLDNQRMCEADDIIIETCNVTGQWSGQDTTLPSKCNDSSYHNEVQGYRNMFCFFCNTDDRHTTTSDETTPYDVAEEVFGIVNDDLINYPLVNYAFVDSYTGRCRRIICPDGRQYVNGSCKSLFNRFNGYLYTICLRLEVGAPKSPDYETTNDFKLGYFARLVSHLETGDIMIRLTANKTLIKIGLCPGGFINATLELALYLSPTQSSISEDESIRYILSKVKEIPDSNNFAPFETLKISQKFECTSGDLAEETSTDICLPYEPPRPTRVYALNEYLGYLYVTKRVVVSKLLMCPQVMLEANEVDYDSEKNEITILANNRSISDVNFQSTNGSYYICIEDYTEMTGVVETEICGTDTTTRAPTSTVGRLSVSSYAFLLLCIGIYMCTCYRV